MTLSRDAVSLAGKVAVVTGAAMGIGRGVALGLHEYGARIAACDREVEALGALGEQISALTYTCDVRDGDAVEAFAQEVRTEFGQVDVLVNNAGGTFLAEFARMSPKGDDAIVRENLMSVVWVTRAFLPLLGEGASVINVTSVEAHRAAPGFSLYGAAKAGVTALTKSLALELGGRGIRVNAVAPDLISTPGVGEMTGEHAALQRGGTVDEVAGVAVFLASSLSSYVTGSTIHVDGGTWAGGGWRRIGEGWRP